MMAGVQKPARLFRLDVNLWSTERQSKVAPAEAPEGGGDHPGSDSPPCVSPIWGVKAEEAAAAVPEGAGDTPAPATPGVRSAATVLLQGPCHGGGAPLRVRGAASHTLCAAGADGTAVEEAAAVGVPEAGGGAGGEVALAVTSVSDDDDGGECSCMICYDAAADHVVLPCGHGGYCKSCATKVFVRPPSQCSVCRTRLTAVVKVSLDTPIGEASAVS